ncbi:MAG: hypothetical protein U0W24_23595 [Bacteroidales bacterium]
MKEYYPYTVLPYAVEKIRSEGIPAPKLPKLMILPKPVKRKYFFTVLFAISLVTFLILAIFTRKYIIASYAAFFVTLFSLVATIFEIVLYVNLKKQYNKDYQLYLEHKEIYKKIKSDQEKIMEQNKNENLVKEFQRERVLDFFKTSYDIIIASHNEYSPAKKRFKLFLEEYFPDEILENIKIVHETKKLEYIPDYIIKFNKPKLNVAIEIEEPYSLSNVPENIQKDYEAKDRLRQRFSNEMGWIIIVLSEEQSVKSPTESCKFIEESIELLFGDIKTGDRFANIKTIKKQKMLTGEERANLKNSHYREKYLSEAGLLDLNIAAPKEFLGNFPQFTEKSLDLPFEKKNGEDKEKSEIIETKETFKNLQDETTEKNLTEKLEKETTTELKEEKVAIHEDKNEDVENEQLMLIKKIAQKAKHINVQEEKKVKTEEPVVFKTDDSLEILNKNSEKQEPVVEESLENKEEMKEETSNQTEQLKKEDAILKNLYSALDKHSRKQKERKEKQFKDQPPVDEEYTTENTEKVIESKLEETEILREETKIKEEIIPEKKEIIPLDEKEETIEEISNVNSESTELQEVETLTQEPESEKNPELENLNVKQEIEEVTTSEKQEALLENKRKVLEESKRNQALIDVYREKIEGAVFDKSWDELMELCNKAIVELPRWDWAYYRRSTAWGNRKEFVRVVEDCNKAIGLNPKLADAYYNRGTARFFLGRFMDAAEDYQKAIDLNYVKKSDAYFNRGLCFQKMDHHKTAYAEFLKARELGNIKAAEVIKNQYSNE